MKRQALTAIFAAIAIVALFLPAALLAQQATTSLNGSVMDSGGAMLPGASITITRQATGQTLHTTANARGEYSFQQLSPGTWTVIVSVAGFADQTKVGELLVSNPATINFQMAVQAISQTVNVSAATTTL